MWLKELFIEKEGSPSIGSVCMAFIVMIWAIHFLWCTYLAIPLAASLEQLAIFCGVVYGVKKVPLAFKKGDNSGSDNS